MSAEAISLGEITATFKLVDQLTPALKTSKASVLEFRDGLYQVVPAVDSLQSKVSGAVPTLEELNKKYGITNRTFQDTNTTVKESASLFDNFSSGLIKGLLGGAVIAGLAALASKVMDVAGNLTAMSQQSGIAATELDRLQRIGVPTKTTLDDIGRAADFLGTKLATGDKSTRGALDAVGLSVDNLMSKNPSQRFEEVVTAVGHIEDPALRGEAALKLLGQADLGAFAANVATAAQNVGQMSDETIANLDRASRAWASFKLGLQDTMGGILGDASGFLTSWRGFLGDLAGALPGALGENLKGYVQGLFDARDGIDKLLPKADAMQKAFDAQHGSLKPLPAALGDAKAAQEAFDRELGPAEKALRSVIKATDDHSRSIQAQADIYTGKALAAKVDDVSAAYGRAITQGGFLAEQLPKLSRDLQNLRSDGAKLPPTLNNIADAFSRNAKVIGRELKPVLYDWSMVEDGTKSLEEMQLAFDHLVKPIKDVHKVIDDLSPTIRELPAPPVDKWQFWHDAAKVNLEDIQQIGLTAVNAIGTAFGENITGMLTGAVSLHDGLSGIWDGIKSAFFNLVDQLIAYWIEKLVIRAISSWAGALAGMGGGGGGGLTSSLLGAGLGGASGVGGAGTGIGLSAPSGAGAAAGSGAAIGAIAGSAAGIGIVLGLGAVLNGTGMFGGGSWSSGQLQQDYQGPQSGYLDNGQLDPNGQYSYQLGDTRQSDLQSGFTFGDQYDGQAMDWQGPSFKEGTDGKFMDFGPGTLAMLHGAEMVVPHDRLSDVVKSIYSPASPAYASAPEPQPYVSDSASLNPIYGGGQVDSSLWQDMQRQMDTQTQQAIFTPDAGQTLGDYTMMSDAAPSLPKLVSGAGTQAGPWGASADSPVVNVTVNAQGAYLRDRQSMQDLGKDLAPFIAKAATYYVSR